MSSLINRKELDEKENIPHFLIILAILCFVMHYPLISSATETNERKEISKIDKPVYSPFIERYILDELKQLRIDLANQRHDIMQQILDREHRSVDRGVSYATDTITYFFYLIAGTSSVLVLLGWTSIRDIRQRMLSYANDEISKLVEEYEQRLKTIESQIKQKTLHIEENREEIERTQEIQSLWLRVQQEGNPANKIAVFDQMLKLRPDDVEVLSYKADAVLELGEPQWATALCHEALEIDPENSHAFFQLACAYSLLGKHQEAITHLKEAISRKESYIEELENENAFEALRHLDEFNKLLKKTSPT